MENYNYRIKIVEQSQSSVKEIYEKFTKTKVIARAKQESKEDNQVFVVAYNSKREVFLNPNGHFEPTGKSW